MKTKLMTLIAGALLLITITTADVIPVSKNSFLDTRSNNTRSIKSDFIVIELTPRGTGRYYYIDSAKAGNTVVWSHNVAAGRPNSHRTPSGIFKVWHRKRKHMSTKYPDPSGINNMNYSMFFHGGMALHQGNPWGLSHGCVHLRKTDAKRVFNTTKMGTPVIVTRGNYSQFLTSRERKYIFKKK